MNQPTPRQLSLLKTLIAKHDVPEVVVEHMRNAYTHGVMTKEVISGFLTMIDMLPLKPEEDTVAVNNTAVYQVGRTIVRATILDDRQVKTSVLVKDKSGKYRYVDKHVVLSELTPERKIPEAGARLLGQETGLCYVCGRKLTDKNSKEKGIGPNCEKNVEGLVL